MSWTDGLVKVLPALKKVKILNGNHLHFSFNVTVNKTDNRKAVVDLTKLPIEERRKIFEAVVPKALDEGVDILPARFAGKVEDYSEKIRLATNQEVLDFFREIIPTGDLPILKASLYLRSVLLSGGDTGLLKQDIIIKWGSRGANISNLCTGHYFEEWFKPLYEEMRLSSDFTLEKFHRTYNEVVQYLPFTLFVNKRMSEEEIAEGIKQKIKMVERYGIETLNIHGIGRLNVKRIREVVDSLPEVDQFEKNVQEEDGIILVRLRKKIDP